MASHLLGREDALGVIGDVVVGRAAGVAFLGPHGVGKTALLDAAAEASDESGVTVHRIYGNPAAADIAFGAAAHLLPVDIGEDRLSALRDTERSLVEASGPRGGVLVVDDADDLDMATTALLHSIATGGRLRLVLATTSERPVSRSLSRIWTDGFALRLDLTSLSRPDTRMLVERALDGSVADEVERRIWELTLGTPLLVHSIVDHSTFVRDGALWKFDGDPLDGERLEAEVEPMLGDLTEPARSALAAFALGHPLAIDVAEAAAGADAIAELERRHIVHEVPGGLDVDRPLLAHVANRRLTSRQRRTIARRLADVLWARPDLDGTDLVRAVGWRLDANEPCEHPTVVHAAEIALSDGDYGAAARLADAALASRADDWHAAFILGQARRQLGDRSGAEQAFAVAMKAPVAADRVNVAVARAHNLGLAAGRTEEALGHLVAVAATVAHEPALVRRLAIEQTFLSSVLGDFRAVADAASLVLDDPDIDDLTALSAANGHLFASVMLLRLDQADRTSARVRPIAADLESMFPLAVDQFDLIDAVAEVARGRIPSSIEACRRRRARGMDQGWGCGEGAWAAVETFARSFTVGPGLDEVAERAVVGLRSLDPTGLRYVGTGIASIGLLHAGDLERALNVWDAATAATDAERRSGALIDARIAAWRLCVTGDTKAAAHRLRDAGLAAIEFGHLLWGMLGLHDAARFGHAEVVTDLLDSIRAVDGEAGQGELLDALCSHAAAAAAADPASLMTCADRFDSMGATRYAVETVDQAARALAAGGRSVEASRASARSQLGGINTIRLPGITPVAAALTDRQADIVTRVLTGATSRDVADHLSLSVRTVDNHLAAVYRNLGVSSRHELTEVLVPLGHLSSHLVMVE